MELPAPLRQAVDAFLEGTPLSEIQGAAQRLSKRYRAETRDGSLHVGDALAAKAYLATRLPATFAAVRQCLSETAARREDFAPSRLLDVGAGPGTALWAARAEWPELGAATLVETSRAMRDAGAKLAEALSIDTDWQAASVEDGLADIASADLVTLCYVLDELAPAARDALVDRLWALTADTLVIVEPGTPAGWQRILAARDRLTALGGYILAPCPHHAPCPVKAPDWCHFSRRVARSRLHRTAKGGEVPWEDEKFSYLAVSRNAPDDRPDRVLAPPKTASGMVRLKLCTSDGALDERLVTRREGRTFKAARKADWGDAL
ncbi:small ribosomal subunit Rsm22 family protein [Nitratireductor aquimarinus]|uniref:small ribosomal subunit Rsm22 family protein n=1 Tax=Nitratireductor aquimarinus TaxID=889300 RepID=UPI002936294D|nr:small ribosomal subunit Rsm22 family protein [Nitratireductor aquimarinus]MDV2966784.1 small ribosomal subunit Rsm22 family protein [Nitratireductor aquimarinus]